MSGGKTMTDLRKAAENVLKIWDKWKGGPFEYEMEALRQALAQPEQEHKFGACVTCGALLEDQIIKQTPKREWVGLTDEDYDELLTGDWGGSLIKSTEARLKEKNGYE
jgi:hypothetical protein